MRPKFVSFFTPAYADEARGLIESLDAFGLDHDVRPLDDTGSWVQNCSRKAAFCREMHAAYAGRPVVWLDADARVRQPPALFDALDCDFGAHWREGWELLSGTLYFGPTTAATELLVAWERECRLFPRRFDQRVLQDVVERMEPAGMIRVERTPAAYTAIFDAGMVPVGEEVVIHMQASRRLRQECA